MGLTFGPGIFFFEGGGGGGGCLKPKAFLGGFDFYPHSIIVSPKNKLTSQKKKTGKCYDRNINQIQVRPALPCPRATAGHLSTLLSPRGGPLASFAWPGPGVL